MNPIASVRQAVQSVLARVPRDDAESEGFGAPARALAARPAVFLDKDGTLVDDVPYNVDPARSASRRMRSTALQLLDRAGYALVVVTNQPGVAAGLLHARRVRAPASARSRRVLAEAGVALAGFYTCPHAPATGRGRLPAGAASRRPAAARGRARASASTSRARG